MFSIPIKSHANTANVYNTVENFYGIHPLIGMVFCEHYSSKINTFESNALNQELNSQIPQLWQAFEPSLMSQLQVRTLPGLYKLVTENFEIGYKRESGAAGTGKFVQDLKNSNTSAVFIAACMRQLL